VGKPRILHFRQDFFGIFQGHKPNLTKKYFRLAIIKYINERDRENPSSLLPNNSILKFSI